jgi:mono/diheme cytochrome c family protein
MGRSRIVFALAAVLLAIVAVAWCWLRTGDPTSFASGTRVELAEFKGPNPTGVPATLAGADLIARGEYLTRAADCAACHTAPGGKPFSGGLPFKLPMIGTLYAPNITPDAETGIGGWSDDDFVRVMHEGIGKDGKHLYPAFPYASYTLMTRDDVLAIKAYLFSLKPVKYTPPRNDISFPFNQRYLMVFWNALFSPNHRFRPNTDQTPDWNRGAYLVEALGHCGDCHTPRNLLFGLKAHEKFAGAVVQGWKAYNITPDQDWGIGAWSETQLQNYLSHGRADGRGSASGPMAEVVDNSLRFLSDADIQAMGTYLASVPAMAAAGSAAAVRANNKDQVAANAGGDHPGLHVFEGACIGCHSFDGSGMVSNYATLIGSRSVNDPEGLNATQAILQGTHVHTTLGKMFMPNFGNGYSDAEIAALVNYVTGQFGAGASNVTPGEVAKRRQAN